MRDYDIADKATLRGLLNERASEALLTNDNLQALAEMDKVREMEDKLSAIATAGLLNRQIAEARIESGAISGPAFEAAFFKEIHLRRQCTTVEAGTKQGQGLETVL